MLTIHEMLERIEDDDFILWRVLTVISLIYIFLFSLFIMFIGRFHIFGTEGLSTLVKTIITITSIVFCVTVAYIVGLYITVFFMSWRYVKKMENQRIGLKLDLAANERKNPKDSLTFHLSRMYILSDVYDYSQHWTFYESYVVYRNDFHETCHVLYARCSELGDEDLEMLAWCLEAIHLKDRAKEIRDYLENRNEP